jgi:pimeloyl-[acyl-carrier protein] methyl ester esterase
LSHNLVFLHGWGTDSSVWKKQISYFSNKYNIETPDIFSNSILNTQYSILIGWSYGGMRAIEMAAAGSGKYEALVLVGSSARFTDGMNPVIIKKILRGLKRDYKRTMRDCYQTFFSESEEESGKGFIKGQTFPDKDVAIEILQRLLVMDIRKKLQKINIPTLIIHGDKDEVCPISGGKFLNDGIAGSSIAVIKDAGHTPFYTRPDEFNNILEEFLGTLDPFDKLRVD